MKASSSSLPDVENAGVVIVRFADAPSIQTVLSIAIPAAAEAMSIPARRATANVIKVRIQAYIFIEHQVLVIHVTPYACFTRESENGACRPDQCFTCQGICVVAWATSR